MWSVEDLNTAKAKDLRTQRELIDNLTCRFASLPRSVLDQIIGEAGEGIIDLSAEPSPRAVAYCLFAMYAADIATVPYQESRNRYLENLRVLVGESHLSYDKVLHLTRYADGLIERYSSHLR
jgi:hypothetical protein